MTLDVNTLAAAAQRLYDFDRALFFRYCHSQLEVDLAVVVEAMKQTGISDLEFIAMKWPPGMTVSLIESPEAIEQRFLTVLKEASHG